MMEASIRSYSGDYKRNASEQAQFWTYCVSTGSSTVH